MNLEVYTTGGGDFLIQIFNYLAAYTSSGNFANLLWIGIMAGSALAALKLVFGGGIRDVITQYLIVAVAGALFLGPRATVIIFDKTKTSLPYASVANVPFGVAFMGSVTSRASFYVTKHMEALLSTPTNLRYQDTGMVFGASLLSQTARWTAVDSTLHRNLVGFLQNCVVDGVNLGHVNLDFVANSGDLIADLGGVLPNSLSYYDVMTSTTQACQAGWPTLVQNVNNEVSAVLAQKAAETYQGNSQGAANNVARMTATLTDFQTMMGMSSASAVNSVRQAMMINAFDGSVNEFIALSGNSAAMSHYQAARAEGQTRASYVTTGASATKWVPYLKIVFECLFYAAFPLALFMMMTPMAAPVLKGYFGGFVWLAAWEPLNAILHSIVLQAASGYYRSAGMVSSNGAVSNVVLSWANHFGVQSVANDVGAVAGYLMMSVPFLAYALLFGANRMMGLATSMLAVGQGAAIETGREAATGNVSLGNVSMSNMAANKWHSSTFVDTGRTSAVMPSGSIWNRNPDSSTSFSQGTALSNGGLSLNLGQSVAREFSERAEEARAAARTTSTELGTTMSALTSRYSDVARQASHSTSSESGSGTTFSESSRRAVSEAWQNVERFSERHGLSTSVGLAAMIAGGAGGKLGPIAKLGADLKMDLQGASTEQFDRAVEAARNSDVQQSLDTLQSASEHLRQTEGRSTGNSASDGNRYGYDEIERLANSLSQSLSEADRYARAEAQVRSMGTQANQALLEPFKSALEEAGYSPAEIEAILNPKTTAAVQANQPLIHDFVDETADGFLISQRLEDPTAGFVTNQGLAPPVPFVPSTTSELGRAATRQREGAIDQHARVTDGRLDELGARDRAASDEHDSQVARVNERGDRLVGTAIASRVGEWVGLSGGEAPGIGRSDYGFTNSDGVYQAPNIRYDLDGKIRNRPVDPALLSQLSGIAASQDTSLSVVITSGGQVAAGSGGTRTGSTRHDVDAHNHGGAVDFYLERDGTPIKPSDDPQLYAAFIQQAAREYPGIGHYDWGLHVGGGAPAFWGPDTTSASADPFFRSAYESGRDDG